MNKTMLLFGETTSVFSGTLRFYKKIGWYVFPNSLLNCSSSSGEFGGTPISVSADGTRQPLMCFHIKSVLLLNITF